MSPARPRTLPAALALAAALAGAPGLGGCGARVRVVPEPLDCPVPAAVLAQRCADPAQVADGASFEQVLQAAGRDRDALRQCAAHDRLLVQALQACNQTLGDYREKLKAINAEAAAAR